jgi:predicted nucleic acid-binding protein
LIVLDASVVVELLTNGPLAESLRRDLAGRDESLIVPHLIDVEVMSALRSLVAGRRADVHRSEQFVTALATLPAERYPHMPLLGRIWELRRITSPLMMQLMLLWLKRPTPSSIRPMRTCAEAIALRSWFSRIDAPTA